jgi:CheY-like chemotaxis protein
MSGNLKVLIVEDESLVAMLIEDLLTDLGHTVVAAVGRMDRALAQAESADVNFAVLDVNLHGERTYPVAEKLAARGIPFVFATGYGQAGLEGAWQNRPVLQKPFQPEDLRAAIESARR